MNNKIKGLVAAGVIAVSPVVTAESFENLYLIADLGTANHDVQNARDDNGAILALGAGFRFNHNIAFEISYNDLGEGSANYSDLQIQQTEATTIASSLVGSFWPGQSVALYLRMGLDVWSIDATSKTSEQSNDSGVDLAYGLGAAFSLTEQLSLRVDYTRRDIQSTLFDEENDARFMTYKVGITYDL